MSLEIAAKALRKQQRFSCGSPHHAFGGMRLATVCTGKQAYRAPSIAGHSRVCGHGSPPCRQLAYRGRCV